MIIELNTTIVLYNLKQTHPDITLLSFLIDLPYPTYLMPRVALNIGTYTL